MNSNIFIGTAVGLVTLLGLYLAFRFFQAAVEALAGLGPLGFSIPLILFVGYLVGNAVLEIRKEKRVR